MENNLLTVLERISDGVISLDEKGELTYINQPAQHILAIKEENPLGKPLCHLIEEDLCQSMVNRITRAYVEQTDEQFDLEYKRDNWLEVRLYSSRDGVTILLKDITARMIVQRKINGQHEKLVLLHEAANHLFNKKRPKELLDALFHELAQYVDLDVYLNYIYDPVKKKLRLMNFCGISESESRQIEWLEMGEGLSGSVARDQVPLVMEDVEVSRDKSVEIVKRIGIRAYACYPLLSYGKLIGTFSFGSSKRSHFTKEELETISTICQQVATTLERIFLICELKEKKEEAEKANHAKAEFLSMMSHELRTPLNSILGFAQILEDNPRDPITIGQKDKIEKILKAGRHLLTLINGILEVAKHNHLRKAERREQIEISTIVSESIKMVNPLADEKGIKLRNMVEPHVDWPIYADTTKVTQVLLNLLVNAVKYTETKGKVWVKVEVEAQQVKVLVCDTGMGIAEEEQEKIFTPFYRILHPELDIVGAGMGLAIVEKLVDEMNGSVGVESLPGKGSCFWFTIPQRRQTTSAKRVDIIEGK